MSTAQLLPNVVQTWLDSNGLPVAGGQLFSYQAGTTTPQATYTDETALTPNTNPTILNSAGQASVWLRTDLSYKLQLQDALNNVLWTVDNVSIVNPGSIDKTKVAANIAGIALAQNGSGAFDVQVDNVSISVNGSNQLQLVANSITPDNFAAAGKQEILIRTARDLFTPGTFEYVPQYNWTTPSMLSDPSTLPPGAATVVKFSPSGEFLAVGSGTTPFLTLYQMINGNPVYIGAPGALNAGTTNTIGTIPGGPVTTIAWSGCGDFLAVGSTGLSGIINIMIYQRDGNSLTALWEPYSRPAPVGGNPITITELEFSPNSDFLVLTYISSTTKSCLVYYRNPMVLSNLINTNFVTATGGSYSITPNSPTTQILIGSTTMTVFMPPCDSTGQGNVVAGQSFSFINGSSGNFTVKDASGFTLATITTGNFYTIINTGTGTLGGVWVEVQTVGTAPLLGVQQSTWVDITSVSTLTGIQNPITWTQDSSLFAAQDVATPGQIDVFQREDYVFSGITGPTFSTTIGTINDMSWSPDGKFLVVAGSSTPYAAFFSYSSGVFTQLSNPLTIPPSGCNCVAWSANSQYVMLGHGTTPYFIIYSVSGTTFTKVADVSSAAAGAILSGDWSATKQYLAVAGSTTPYVQVYKTSSTLNSDAFLWLRSVPLV